MSRKSPTIPLLLLLTFLLVQPLYSHAVASVKEQLVQTKWKLERKILSSHDQSGTDSMAAAIHQNDFIEFKTDGTAIVSYNGNQDTLQYELVNDTLLSFGTTPYRIQVSGKSLRLFQNEEEENGNYNREWLELKK